MRDKRGGIEGYASEKISRKYFLKIICQEMKTPKTTEKETWGHTQPNKFNQQPINNLKKSVANSKE